MSASRNTAQLALPIAGSPLPTSNARRTVTCAWCSEELVRRPFGPNGLTVRFFCNNACKGEWQRTQKPITRDRLYQLYIVEGRGAYDIAKLVGRDPKGVWQWLKGYGIPTRPRGSSSPALKEYQARMVAPMLGKRHTTEAKEKIRQARIRDGHVPYLKNGVHYLKGKRGPEVHMWRGGLTPERQAFYRSEEWKRACTAVWHRADAKCERCGLDHRTIDRKTQRFHVHHIVSFQVRELRAEPSNLALLCDRCHRWVHSKANVERSFIKEATAP